MKSPDEISFELLLRLQTELGLPNLKSDAALFSNGTLDSIELFKIVTLLEAEYQIKIPAFDVSLERFDTVKKIAGFLSSKLEG